VEVLLRCETHSATDVGPFVTTHIDVLIVAAEATLTPNESEASKTQWSNTTVLFA
jgi:hypothetical protein